MSYFLPEGYVERLGAKQNPQAEAKIDDKWQDEVYREAAKIASEISECRVLDYGTGSGFKLMKHFGELCILDVVGIDLPATVEILRRRYPLRCWSEVDKYLKGGMYLVAPPDLVICSDVIEHVSDPDALLGNAQKLEPEMARTQHSRP
jgi:2-polyprenyl-3-methyl-5-hydroxy-6-metoxy-1,4-benzoquinol methylase